MSLKVLFIPVSTSIGVGEYVRSLTIAEIIEQHIPNTKTAFVISEQAPYANSCPYKAFLTPSSPTMASTEVIKILSEFTPDIVIFDGAGRVKQYEHCKKLGAATVFICQHNKKRNKGLRWRRLKFLDMVWDVQPSFSRQSLSRWSQLKLKLLKKPLPREVGPIHPSFTDSYRRELLEQLQVEKGKFVVVNAGGGGQTIHGASAAQTFAEASVHLSKTLDEKLLIIYGPNFRGSKLRELKENITELQNINSMQIGALLSCARAAILGGGDTLLQAMRYNTPTVAVSLAHDQPKQIQACMANGNVIQSQLSDTKIVDAFIKLHNQTYAPKRTRKDNHETLIKDVIRLTDNSARKTYER